MKSFPDTFCIVDTETTGMRAAFSRIIDIGIIRVENGKVVKRYETLIHPGVSIPWRITSITGLSNEDLAGAPPFEDVALEIEEMLEGAVFVAHNVAFDYSFVQNEFKRIGIAWSAPKLCSVNLSRSLFPKEKAHNLDMIIERFKIKTGTRHRAMPDAEAVLSFFKKLEKETDKELLSSAIEKVLDKSSPRTSASELPDSAGVYFFYGPEQELLYIGKSKHVRTRVRSHFHRTGVGKEKRLQGETSLIQTVKTSGELSALLLEANLIKEEGPLYNRALRNRKKLVIAKESVNAEGYATLSLESTSTIKADNSIVSVFRTMSQAKQKLQTLVREQKLCPKLSGLDKGDKSCFDYQLRKCTGACIGKEESESYNNRLREAFAARRMRHWPYSGPVLITEQEHEDAGTIFIVDNWILKHAYTYEQGAYQPFLKQGSSFDYDTYKILVRYMLDAKNKRNIRTLSNAEYRSHVSHFADTYEDVVYL